MSDSTPSQRTSAMLGAASVKNPNVSKRPINLNPTTCEGGFPCSACFFRILLIIRKASETLIGRDASEPWIVRFLLREHLDPNTSLPDTAQKFNAGRSGLVHGRANIDTLRLSQMQRHLLESIDDIYSGNDFEAADDMQPEEIAELEQVDLESLLLLNKQNHVHGKAFKSNSRLKAGTKVRLPFPPTHAPVSEVLEMSRQVNATEARMSDCTHFLSRQMLQKYADPDHATKAGQSRGPSDLDIGDRLMVYWPADQREFQATVMQYDPNDCTYRLRYADGEMWQDLALFKHRKLEAAAVTAIASTDRSSRRVKVKPHVVPGTSVQQ